MQSVTRRQSLLLYAFSIWTVWVWGTRIGNVWRDHQHGAGFKAVHTVLAAVSVAFAVAAWVVVRRLRRGAAVVSPRVDEAAGVGPMARPD